MENSKPIFISYSRLDKNIVFPFVKRIEQELKTTCWIDSEGIESGSQFEEVIVNAIEESKVVLFMLSDNSINSKWTKREVLYAEDEGKRIVPVVVDKKGLRKWFKFHFGNVDYIDINDEGQCDKLLNNLASWIGVEGMSKKDCYTKTSADIEPKIQISADKSVITLSIHNGLNLTLKRDYERNCFVGEVPVQKILEMFNGNIGRTFLGNGIVSSASAKAAPIGMVNSVGGAIAAIGVGIMTNIYNDDYKKDKIFKNTVLKLNQRYGLHLIKRNISHSDFTVEVNADSIYYLLRTV